MFRYGAILVLMSMLLIGVVNAADKDAYQLDQIQKDLEQSRYQKLALVEIDPQLHLAAFTTDGCSGGLSDGWRFLAGVIPAFKQKFGNKPPYESCCVTHDRAYWRGETQDGYNKRLQADRTLQHCVADYGRQHRDEFAHEFNLSADTIETNFKIVAALMYRAVRVGGMPCTVFPWRWGYGWPACHAQDK